MDNYFLRSDGEDFGREGAVDQSRLSLFTTA